jgi:hypothetical protein
MLFGASDSPHHQPASDHPADLFE